jgi:hypothetical protein
MLAVMKIVALGVPAAYLAGAAVVTVGYLWSFSDLPFVKAFVLGARWPVMALQSLGWI